MLTTSADEHCMVLQELLEACEALKPLLSELDVFDYDYDEVRAWLEAVEAAGEVLQ